MSLALRCLPRPSLYRAQLPLHSGGPGAQLPLHSGGPGAFTRSLASAAPLGAAAKPMDTGPVKFTDSSAFKMGPLTVNMKVKQVGRQAIFEKRTIKAFNQR